MLRREEEPHRLTVLRACLMDHGSVMVGAAKNDPICTFIALSLAMTGLDLLCSFSFLRKSYQSEITPRVTDPRQSLVAYNRPQEHLLVYATGDPHLSRPWCK